MPPIQDALYNEWNKLSLVCKAGFCMPSLPGWMFYPSGILFAWYVVFELKLRE